MKLVPSPYIHFITYHLGDRQLLLDATRLKLRKIWRVSIYSFPKLIKILLLSWFIDGPFTIDLHIIEVSLIKLLVLHLLKL